MNNKKLPKLIFLLYFYGIAKTELIMNLPLKAANNKYTELGCLDVTLYGADPSGEKDSTKAIQKAVREAYEYNLVCFFPSGTYLVSDTINCIQFASDYNNANTIKANVLVGSSKGKRPVIKLADNAAGFNDDSVKETEIDWKKKEIEKKTTLKAVFNFWQNPPNSDPNTVDIEFNNGNRNYNQVIKGLAIDLSGKDHKGAVGIRFKGAQGCAAQDITIIASNSFAGVFGMPGNGASVANIEIIGGEYGIYSDLSLPGPLAIGITMINQNKLAVYFNKFTPFTLVGFKIIKTDGYAFEIDRADLHCSGNLSLIDGSIEFRNPSKPAIHNKDRSLYIKNVYFKNIEKIIENDDGDDLSGNIKNWVRIKEYAYCNVYKNVKVINGKFTDHSVISLDLKIEKIPEDLLSSHLWSEDFPTFEDNDIINVKDFGAKGNGDTDDTEALQKAINKGKKVFLPKGEYLVNNTLLLKKDTHLFGIAKNLSIINPSDNWEVSDFTPVIQTADDPDAETSLSFIKVYMPIHKRKIYFVKWMAGKKSIVREVWLWKNRGKDEIREIDMQRILITGNGGGKWYHVFQGMTQGTFHPNFRYLLIQGTTQTLNIYFLVPEYCKSDYQTEIRNSRNVSLFMLKAENALAAVLQTAGKEIPKDAYKTCRSLLINSSENIYIIGTSGHSYVDKGMGLIEVKNSDNYVIANSTRWGASMDAPDTWYFVKDIDYNIGITADNICCIFKKSSGNNR
ncbi:MAG: hypothetical protein A2096_13035 [Spirochaetes bacterium GWF1_41_5]|nr:MAG: hypothetical protein A2096_13035 [Spirochaetes bacterium GWF1_41_5]HBE04724.1 hypothetical protein [Spirochaetia bacterium]